MKLQADIPEELNKHLKMHKVRFDLATLEDALIDVLAEFFKQPKKNFNIHIIERRSKKT